MQSKWLERFKHLSFNEPHRGCMRVYGDTLIVEKLPPQEVATKSGIIIADASTHKKTMADGVMSLAVVLMVGEGTYDEDGVEQELTTQVGDVIVVNPLAVEWWSHLPLAGYEPDTIGYIREGQVRITFPDYNKAFEVLNG